jgi:ribose transport system ATP-binding protein
MRGLASVAPTGTPFALEVTEVSKAFGPTQALASVSFSAARGTIHALLGGNGSGKSTLIKVLAGVQSGDSGSISVQGVPVQAADVTPQRSRDLGLRFVHQQSSTFAELTVAENLFIGDGFEARRGFRIPWRELHYSSLDILERFGIHARPTEPLGNLSPANQTMVAIARALKDQEASHSGVLVLDEPTASLPAQEVDLLLAALRRYADAGQTIVFVTHRLEEVLRASDVISVLRDGRLVDTVEALNLGHDDLIELIMGRKIDRFIPRQGIAPDAPIALSVDGLIGGPLRGVDLTLREGEIVGLAGLLGSGRSSLLRMLCGLQSPDAGRVELQGKEVSFPSIRRAMAAGIAFVPEDRTVDAAFSDLSVTENLTMACLSNYFTSGYLHRRQEARHALRLVPEYLIKTESVTSLMSALSGGNQQKVVLGRWLRRDPSLLLLDEPSQGVDVGARLEIWELIRRRTLTGMAVLVASSDYEELAGVCDRVLVLSNGAVASELSGAELTDSNLEHRTLEAMQ